MSINQNNITDVNDSTILENTPMMVVKQGGQTLAIPVIQNGGGGGVEQVQADWAQTDDTAVDFIKNKPEIPQKVSDLSDASAYAKKSDVPSKVADLTDGNQYAKKTEFVQADWAVTDSTSAAYIKNKPEIAPGIAIRNIIRHESIQDAIIDVLEANTLHIFTSSIKTLTINAVEDSDFSSEIHFTTSTGFEATLPDDVSYIGGSPIFLTGVSYIINIKNSIAVVVQYE